MINALQNFDLRREIYLHSQKHFNSQTGLTVISEKKAEGTEALCVALPKRLYLPLSVQ